MLMLMVSSSSTPIQIQINSLKYSVRNVDLRKHPSIQFVVGNVRHQDHLSVGMSVDNSSMRNKI